MQNEEINEPKPTIEEGEYALWNLEAFLSKGESPQPLVDYWAGSASQSVLNDYEAGRVVDIDLTHLA